MAVGRPGISVLASPHRLRLLRGALGSTEREQNRLSGLVGVCVSRGSSGRWDDRLKQTLNGDVQVGRGYDKLLVHRGGESPLG